MHSKFVIQDYQLSEKKKLLVAFFVNLKSRRTPTHFSFIQKVVEKHSLAHSSSNGPIWQLKLYEKDRNRKSLFKRMANREWENLL